jgi:hypothetical protein
VGQAEDQQDQAATRRMGDTRDVVDHIHLGSGKIENVLARSGRRGVAGP